MAELIRYLLLANIFLVLLSLFYRLILSNENLFKTNRAVILTGLVIALTIPLINFDFLPSPTHALIVIPEAIVSNYAIQPDIILDEIQIIGTAPTVFPWITVFQTLYFMGVLAMLMSFISRINHIRSLQKTYPMKWFMNLFISILPTTSSSFSFLSVVYHPGPIIPDDKRTQLILEHERVHISQKHSWDLIFLEVIKIVFFYNPAIYTLRKQLKLTHEFLADQEVAKVDKKQYSLSLIQDLFDIPHLTLSHAFNQSSTLKKRFIMLQKNTRNKWAAAKYFMTVPMLGTFMVLSFFTTVNAQEKKTKEEIAKKVVEVELKEAGFNNEDIREIQRRIDQKTTGSSKEVSNPHPSALKTARCKTSTESTNRDVFYIVEDMPSFEGKSLDHYKNWVQKHVKYPQEALKKKISGTVYAQFIVNQEGKPESIEIVRSPNEILSKEVIRTIESAPLWVPGKQRGMSVSVSMAIPVDFKLK